MLIVEIYIYDLQTKLTKFFKFSSISITNLFLDPKKSRIADL